MAETVKVRGKHSLADAGGRCNRSIDCRADHSMLRRRSGVRPVGRFVLGPVRIMLIWITCIGTAWHTTISHAGDLVVQLGNAERVVLVGVVNRWDQDGNPRTAINPTAKIDAPHLDARGVSTKQGEWLFSHLPAGCFDLIIMAGSRLRIEGFHYPPVLEFDEVLKHTGKLDEQTRQTIVSDIAQSRHYENKVTPLFMSGNAKQVRVLVQLLRDKKTSYDGAFGQPVATLRHEVWQYTNRYGAWSKEKRTRVIDRILMGRRDLRTWSWIWDPKLGGIDLQETGRVTVRYEIPRQRTPDSVRGLLPY